MDDIQLTGVKKTLAVVLQAKALDNRLPDPILGDAYAERTMRQLDPVYDERKHGTTQAGIIAAVRAKAHDDWARRFLDDHPDAVVLHLGCGLDARAYRVDPHARVDWYELDYPDVIELRKRLLPHRDHYTPLGSSVTDPSWLDVVSRDRPVLMIAEGLLPYLTVDEVRSLITTIVDRFPSGQLQCDLVPRWIRRTSIFDPGLRRFGVSFHSGFASPRELADWRPQLEFQDEVPIMDSPLLAKAPRDVRVGYRMLRAIPGMRRSYRVARYRF